MPEPTSQSPVPEPGTQVKPGDSIVPAGAPRAAGDRVSVLDTPTLTQEPPKPQPQPEVVEKPVIPPEPKPPTSQQPQQAPTPQNEQPDQEGASSSAVEPKISDPDAITWTASEFVAHEKSASWYGMLVLAAAAATAVIFLITKDKISSAVVPICALALGVIGARKPRSLQYQVDNYGVTVGDKHHGFEEFRSFTVATEGAFSSIIFKPLKRFAVLTSIYCAPEDEDRIIDMLEDRLPYEEHEPDVVDRLMRRIRF